MPIFVIFIVIPLIELALFASVSEHIGIFTTLMLAFLTAIIGGGLVKHQGLQTLFSMQKSANEGAMPLNEIFDGFCIVAAGALLITPGFLTDFVGFALLVPAIRSKARDIIKDHTSWTTNMSGGPSSANPSAHRYPTDPNIIEGEFEELNEETNTPPHDKLS